MPYQFTTDVGPSNQGGLVGISNSVSAPYRFPDAGYQTTLSFPPVPAMSYNQGLSKQTMRLINGWFFVKYGGLVIIERKLKYPAEWFLFTEQEMGALYRIWLDVGSPAGVDNNFRVVAFAPQGQTVSWSPRRVRWSPT
jgi:hypothetical protein